MTKAGKLVKAKEQINALIAQILVDADAIQTDDFKNVIQTTVDGQEIYVEVSLVAKNYQATKTSEAFNPIEANENYLFDVEQKRIKAENAKKEKEVKNQKVKVSNKLAVKS